jgi:hypothetical protein
VSRGRRAGRADAGRAGAGCAGARRAGHGAARGAAALLIGAAALLSGLGAGAAWAQGSALAPRPWRPAGGDSVSVWAGEARALLLGSRSDALGPEELRAYSLHDRIARAYFRSLGRGGMRAAVALEGVLDSLKLAGRVSQKPEFPTFVLVHFRNPHLESRAALAYLYWFRGDELRSQPIDLKGGLDPDLQVFWIGDEAVPYEAGLLYYRGLGVERAPELYLFRMLPKADAWVPVQVGDADVRLGGKGTGAWVDIDRDTKPELLTWTEGLPDTLFIPCTESSCPRLVTERVFVRSREGFRLYEQRTVASPYATLVLFLRALGRGEEEFARTLAHGPGVMARARELGWVGLRRGRSFAAVPLPRSDRWPDRLRFNYAAPGRPTTFLEVRFVNLEGHWFLEELVTLSQPGTPARGAGPGSAPADSARVAPGARPAGGGR